MTYLPTAQKFDDDVLATILSEIRSLSRQIETLMKSAAIAARAGGQVEYSEAPGPDDATQADLAEELDRIYRNRRKRDWEFRDYDLFHDPAWDILLDVSIAEQRGIKLPVSSVCIGASVPTTTALRWITLLEEKGLLFRESDPADSRRSYVRPTDEALSLMNRYVTSLLRPERPAR